jgi:hypothetical protein
MLFSRLVVLLNLPEPCTHGEARLFDPDGKIRKTLCFSLSSMPYYDLQKNTKHADTKRSIALYALSQIHIEPVNTNVLGQYRVKSVRTYILHTFDNIYCMHAKDVCFNPKIQLPGINIEDTIDKWLDDDEDISRNSHRTREHKCLGSVQGKKCENIHTTYLSFGPNVL